MNDARKVVLKIIGISSSVTDLKSDFEEVLPSGIASGVISGTVYFDPSPGAIRGLIDIHKRIIRDIAESN